MSRTQSERGEGPGALTVEVAEVTHELWRSPLLRQRGQDARTLLKLPDLRLVVVVLKAGAQIPEHRTDRRPVLHVLSGRLDVLTNGEAIEVGAGTALVLEPTAPHGVRAREDTAFLLSLGAVTPGVARAGESPALAALQAEHRRFHNLLELVEEQLDLLESGDDLDYGVLQDVFAYLLEFPDRFHHPKEDLLFARLSRRHPDVQADVLALRRLHRQLATCGARFVTTLESAQTGAVLVRRDALAALGRGYVARFREHLELEAERVFPLARQHLTWEDWVEAERELAASLAAARSGRMSQSARLRQLVGQVDCDCLACQDL